MPPVATGLYILQVRYEPHLSDKVRCSEAARFSISNIWYAYVCMCFRYVRIPILDLQSSTNINREGHAVISFYFHSEANIIIHGVYLGTNSLFARLDMQYIRCEL